MFLALFFLSAISTEDLRKEFPTLPGDEAIVQDAIARMGSDPREMQERVPIVIYFRDRRCVVLYLRRGGLGNDAIFCYNDANELVEVSTAL